MVRWYFSHAFVDIQAARIVDQFALAVPRDMFAINKEKSVRKRMDRADLAARHMVTEVHRFQKDEKLNIFQRARLAQQIQNRMISLGYPLDASRQLPAVLVGTTSVATFLASLVRAQ